MITVVLSVYKVASFPDGGGHFWVYLQYALGLRRLGCEVYWLEQLRPARDREREARTLSTFLERMKQLGFEGRTLLYTVDRERHGGAAVLRFIGCTRAHAETVLRRADLMLNFHYAIDPQLLACARRTALVDIDPGLLQFWMSTGQLAVPAHDCYLTTGETVGTPAARFSDCGLRWQRIRPPVCLELWPFTYDPQAEAFTTVSSWSTTDWLKVTENGKTVLRENTKRVAFLPYAELPRHTSQPLELASTPMIATHRIWRASCKTAGGSGTRRRSRRAPRPTVRTSSGRAASSAARKRRTGNFRTRGSATGPCAISPAGSRSSCKTPVRALTCPTGTGCSASPHSTMPLPHWNGSMPTMSTTVGRRERSPRRISTPSGCSRPR